MNTQYVLSLTFAFFFLFFFSFSGAQAATITFTNICSYTVWPVTSTAGHTQLSTTGFELASGASTTVDVPSPWSGSIWTRTGCSTNSSGKFICSTADCGSGQVQCNGTGSNGPATLIELAVAANGGQDFYDLSTVDGFNVPVSIAPQGGNGECKTSSCPANINKACPEELKVVSPFGDVVACNSPCLAFNQDPYCCTSESCYATEYAKFFKQQCPDAYSYASDDNGTTFTCSGAPNYSVMFCPPQIPYLMCIFHGSS